MTAAARPDGRLTVVFAPDSFKGSLSSVEVARALAEGWARARPDDELLAAPLADGGEGTLAAIEAAGGWERHEARVRDPLGRPIAAGWLRSDDVRTVANEESHSDEEHPVDSHFPFARTADDRTADLGAQPPSRAAQWK